MSVFTDHELVYLYESCYSCPDSTAFDQAVPHLGTAWLPLSASTRGILGLILRWQSDLFYQSARWIINQALSSALHQPCWFALLRMKRDERVGDGVDLLRQTFGSSHALCPCLG
jgi:hypothetical protein